MVKNVIKCNLLDSIVFQGCRICPNTPTRLRENSDKIFAVVKFVTTNDVAVVPIGWIENGKCFWPPKEFQNKVMPYELEENPIAETWEQHRVKILGFYATYRDALSKLSALVNDKGLVSRQESQLLPTSMQSDVEDIQLEDLHNQNDPMVNFNHPPNIQNIGSSFRKERSAVEEVIVRKPGFMRNKEGKKPASVSVFSQGVKKVPSSGKQISKYTPVNRSMKGEIEMNQNIILESLNLIMEQESPKPSTSTSEPTSNDLILDLLTKMPLKSDEDMDRLEMRLSEEGTLRQMVQVLRGLGGSNANHLITLMMKKVITDQYASTYSFLGIRGKKPFKGLKIYHAIMSAIRTNTQRIEISEYDADKIISNWLRHAKTRSIKVARYQWRN